MARPKKIRIDWKGFPGTNTSFLQTFVNYDREKFYKIGPWFNICRECQVP